jgi:hypothetical protein
MRDLFFPAQFKRDDVFLTFWGVHLSVKQLLGLLLGAVLSYDWWLNLQPLQMVPGGIVGIVLRVLLTVPPGLLTIAFTFVRRADRSLLLWLYLLVQYQRRPKRCVWRSIRWQTRADDLSAEEGR